MTHPSRASFSLIVWRWIFLKKTTTANKTGSVCATTFFSLPFFSLQSPAPLQWSMATKHLSANRHRRLRYVHSFANVCSASVWPSHGCWAGRVVLNRPRLFWTVRFSKSTRNNTWASIWYDCCTNSTNTHTHSSDEFCTKIISIRSHKRTTYPHLHHSIRFATLQVLYFYPLDWTFVCPTEIIEFSDRYADFKALNANILGGTCSSLFNSQRSSIFYAGYNYTILFSISFCSQRWLAIFPLGVARDPAQARRAGTYQLPLVWPK